MTVIEFSAIRSCVRIDGMRSHLIRANLRRLHELVVDAQHSNAIFFAQGIGAVNDVLFQCIHIDGVDVSSGRDNGLSGSTFAGASPV